jgi:formate dehydrogenase subunit delta
MQPEKLEMMANQIGTFFSSQGRDNAPEAIADHITKFWDPGMRRELIGLRDRDACKLSADVMAAIDLLDGA